MHDGDDGFHAVVGAKAKKYLRVHFMIRRRLYSGLRKKTTQIGALADDKRLTIVLPQACCYWEAGSFWRPTI